MTKDWMKIMIIRWLHRKRRHYYIYGWHFITFMVVHFITFMVEVLLHLWLTFYYIYGWTFITFMVVLHLWLIFYYIYGCITFMVDITFMVVTHVCLSLATLSLPLDSIPRFVSVSERMIHPAPISFSHLYSLIFYSTLYTGYL